MPKHEELVEPDITINGEPLIFSQALTLRVAITHFALWCESESEQLGPVGDNYRARAREILWMMGGKKTPEPAGPREFTVPVPPCEPVTMSTADFEKMVGRKLPAGGERRWEIWAEGYAASGDSAPARYVGCATALTFKDACIRYYREHPKQAGNFDPERLTDWACRLFDNRADARKAFG